ncbi:MAG: serine/threonine-protein kinase HipA [Phenylobacterium sp.]|jgi:serine/threonine-protein kinase HipA
MGRTVSVYMYDRLAGVLNEEQGLYTFIYDAHYRGKPISLSMPVSPKEYVNEGLHSYFSGLAPEGWLRQRYGEVQRIDKRDTLGFLIANGKDLLGAITLKS